MTPVEIIIKPIIGQANLLMDFDALTLAAIAGTGGGKTILGYWWLHSRMEKYPGHGWGVAEPTYPMLSKVILTSPDPDRPSIEDYFERAGHHPHYRAVDRIIETDFGLIYLGSADNPDSMQGAALKGYWLDEAGMMSLLAYETAQQRVAMFSGQVLITTTPYNMGWLKTDIADKQSPTIHVESWRSVDRPGFPMARYEAMRASMSRQRFAMMFDALFEQPEGLIYDSFDTKTCVISRFVIPKDWPRYVGHDFGLANPAAVFYAQDPSTGYFYLYHEYLPGSGRSTAQHVEEFKKLTEGTIVLKRAGGSHQEEEIREAYRSHGWPIQEPKIKDVTAGIDRVYGLHKLNKVFVFSDMRHYLDEKLSYCWKTDTKSRTTDDILDKARYHLVDSERYILSDFTPETVLSIRIATRQAMP